MSKRNPAPAPTAPAKVAFKLDGPDVTREISMVDIRSYMTRKGFRLGTRDGARPKGSEMHLLCSVGEFTMSTPVVVLYDFGTDDARFLLPVVVAIAKCLNRDCAEVLREIAGEVVTLEDAHAALVVACAGYGISIVSAIPSRDDDLSVVGADAANLANTARRTGAHAKGNHVDGRIRIALAAEDLASIALAELRSQRATGDRHG